MEDYIKKPCERCGSKKRVSKRWYESLKTFTGSIRVKHTQIICTNKECQRVFDENLAAEVKKRADMRNKKEESDKIRKSNSLALASKARQVRKSKPKI